MAQFVASLMDAETGSDNKYDFDGPDDLMKMTPVRVIRHFMEIVDKQLLPSEHIDYELNAAMRNKEAGVITGIGSLIRENGGEIPFLLMISQKR